MLRPLVNQPQITLFMVTIGLAYFLEGVAQGVWGAQVHALEIGIQDKPFTAGVSVSQFDLFASGTAALLVLVLAVFFQKTKTARAARPTTTRRRCRSGFSSSTSGRSCGRPRASSRWWRACWGARTGVQFALTFTALKALPVLILGGFESIPAPSSAA